MNGSGAGDNELDMERTERILPTPVELVLVDAGDDLVAVAGVLRDVLALCLPDPSVLGEAVPLTLLAQGSLKEAEQLSRLLARAGGRAEIHPARESYQGVRKPLGSRKAA